MINEMIIPIITFAIGYLFGRLIRLEKKLLYNNSESNKSIFSFNKKSNSKQSKNISIDNSKFVTDVKTNTFKKDFDELGNKTKSKNDIASSVSKLSQIKKK